MIQTNQCRIILASASPRRRELLQAVGLQFDAVPSQADEPGWTSGTPAAAYARALAVEKARAVAQNNPDAIVIGADTIVVCNGKVLGKPTNDADAVRMLRNLSGRSHEVVTGLAVVAGTGPCIGKILIAHECTTVFFRPLSDEEITAYVASGEPRDKAGAYGIQGKAGLFVTRLEGCYFNVVGLPLSALGRLLAQCGVQLL